MGVPFSKFDASIIQAIEANVINLLIRLREEEIYINDFVKVQTLKALEVYTHQIDKNRQYGHISRHKTFKLKDLILRATNKLKDIKTCEHDSDNTHSGKELNEMKNELLKIRNRMENHQIQSEECENILKVVQAYVKKIGENENTMDQDEKNGVSVLVLRIFLKSPPKKVSDVLQSNLDILTELIESFKKFNWKQVNSSGTEEVKLKLEEFTLKLDHLNHIIEEDGIERNTSETSNSLLFKEITDDLNEFEFLTNKLGSLTGENVLTFIRSKVLFLITQLKERSEKGEEAEVKKRFLLNKGIRILNKLNRIKNRNVECTQGLRTLEEIEKKVLTLVNSDECFASKKSSLEEFQAKVHDLKIRSNEFINQKIKILNKIEGFIILEAARDLRQVEEFIKIFKVYAQNFSFPKNVNIYEFRKNELISVLKFLYEEMPKEYDFIDSRVQFMRDKIQVVLEMLERKAIENQNLFSILDQLDFMKEKVNFINSMPNTHVSKLREWNRIRQRMQIIDNFDYRIVNKKNEICLQLHEIEEQMYSECSEKLQELKILLNEFEKKVQEFSDEIDSKDYQKHKDDLQTILFNIEEVNEEEEKKRLLKETVLTILNLLDKVSTDNKNQNDRLTSLNSIEKNMTTMTDLTSEQKTKALEECEEVLWSFKCSSKDLATYNKISNTERCVIIEKSKLRLKDMKNELEIIKENLDKLYPPLNLTIFKKHLISLLNLKETAEDMSEGNKELDFEKTEFLQEVSVTIQRLDNHFNRNLMTKTMRKIFEMKKHFDDFGLEEIKDSEAFVQAVLKRAQNYENCVRHYLGTDQSIDYQAIHQDLEKMVNNLEGLGCEDEQLLQKVRENVNYVKGLICELELNAGYV